MKTGNAILASFFFGMAVYVPVKLLTLISQYAALIKYLPPGLDSISFVIIIFIVFLVFGIVTIVLGRDKSERTSQRIVRKTHYREPEPDPEIEEPRKKTKIRFDKPDEKLDLSDLIN